MTNDPANNPHDAYQARANDIAKLMSALQMELKQRDKDTHDWGTVGDLGKIRSDLIDMVGFISGFEREDIEEFLAE